MNILVLSWRDPKHPLSGGAEQVMHEHMKGWVGAGHKVTLFSSKFPESKENETIDSINIVRRGYQYWGVQFSAFYYYIKNKNKIDLLVDQFHGIPFFTPLYSNKPKIAVIQEVAREVWLANPLPKPLNWIIGTIGYIGEPLLFIPYRNTKFMTGSASAKKELTKFGINSKNITIIPHGVITEKVKAKKEKTKTVTFLGVLSKDKGIEDAIKCFHILDKKGKYQFWIIGKAETPIYLKQLKQLTKKLGFKNKIKFWGFVSQKEKFKLLAKSHVLVNPSIREGWGLVNIEANSVGTPAIAYKSPGLIDSVKNNKSGIICNQNNPKNIANEIHNLLENTKRYSSLSKGAIKWSENFSWEHSRNLSLELIDKYK